MLGSISMNAPYTGVAVTAETLNQSKGSQIAQGSQTEGVAENQGAVQNANMGAGATAGSSENVEDDPEVQSEIQELVIIEDKVIAHEQAHMSVGGEFAGGASYSYTVGPDGKRYISGGEVSISIPSVDDPERMLSLLERVRETALAPADPSSQDIRVASRATSQMAKVNAEIAVQKTEEAYGNKASENTEAVSQGQESENELENLLTDLSSYGPDGMKQKMTESLFSIVI